MIRRLRDYDDLIATLRQAWLTRGPTQEALARRMGCSRPQAAAWLAGKTGAGPRRLFDLADALGYDLALIPRAEPDCAVCGGPCRDETDLTDGDTPGTALRAPVTAQQPEARDTGTPEADAAEEWVCFPCGYRNVGGVCTHCGWVRAAERTREATP